MRVASPASVARPVGWAAASLVLMSLAPPGAQAQIVACDPEPTNMTIPYGQSTACTIDVDGDVDQFRFSGTAGELVRVQAFTHLGSRTACLELFDPDGTPVHTGCAAAAVTTRTLAKSGVYRVLVTEQFNDETMPYTIGVERIAPPSATARALGYGITLSDTIDIKGDVDLFVFNAVGGDLVRLQMVSLFGSRVACVELFDPDAMLVHDGCGLDAVTTRTLAKSGTYLAIAREQSHDETTSYTISLTCISGVCPPPPQPVTFQISGQVRDLNDSPLANIPVNLSGSLTRSATSDVNGAYSFSALTPGGTYQVTPARPLFTFTPATQTFPNLTENEVADPFVVTAGVFTRYFAEGATGPFFTTRISLLNATGTASEARVTFQKPGGATVDVPVSLKALDSRTIDPATFPGLEDTALATVIESTQPVIADRTMRWDGRGYGSHTETSIAAPSTQWYLAEGATTGFQLFYLIQNPGPAVATVQVTYLRASPLAPLVKSYLVPGSSRFNIWVNVEQFDTPGGPQALLAAAEFSASIGSDAPVIVERAMYVTRGGRQFDAGHESAASPELSTTWFLAEGATGPYFDLFALIANPNEDAAEVTVTYFLPASSFSKVYTVDALSRFNIWADVDDPRLADTAVSMALTSTNGVPILVERAMWWPGDSTTWFEGHNSRGAIQAGEKWGLAAGEVGGPLGLETYVLLANTSAFPATVQVTVVFEDGTTIVRAYPVPAASRFNVPVASFIPETVGKRFGVVVESLPTTGGTAQIVVERASYNNAVVDGRTVVWAAGASAFGTRLR